MYKAALDMISGSSQVAAGLAQADDVLNEKGSQWSRARELITLPTRLGGIGLQSLARTTSAAFLGSLALTAADALAMAQWAPPADALPTLASAASTFETPPASLPPAFNVIPGLAAIYASPPSGIILPLPLSLVTIRVPQMQRKLAEALHTKAAEAFKRSLGTDRLAHAHYAGVTGAHSGAFLNALRGRDRRFQLKPAELRTALRLRLGLPITTDTLVAPCKCADRSAQWHLFCCPDTPGRRGRTLRHSDFKYGLLNGIKSFAPAPSPEIKVETRVREILHPRQQLTQGQDLIADLVITLPPVAPAKRPITRIIDTVLKSNFASSTLDNIKTPLPEPGFAALQGEQDKIDKYGKLFHVPSQVLVPAAGDLFGSMGSMLLDFLTAVFPSPASTPAGTKRNVASKRLAINLMSTAIARGNHRCVLCFTHPTDTRLATREEAAASKPQRKQRAPRTSKPSTAGTGARK